MYIETTYEILILALDSDVQGCQANAFNMNCWNIKYETQNSILLIQAWQMNLAVIQQNCFSLVMQV